MELSLILLLGARVRNTIQPAQKEFATPGINRPRADPSMPSLSAWMAPPPTLLLLKQRTQHLAGSGLVPQKSSLCPPHLPHNWWPPTSWGLHLLPPLPSVYNPYFTQQQEDQEGSQSLTRKPDEVTPCLETLLLPLLQGRESLAWSPQPHQPT